MNLSFYSESGKELRREWMSKDQSDTAPQVGDQIIMDNGDILTVAARTFSFVEGSDGQIQSIFLTLR